MLGNKLTGRQLDLSSFHFLWIGVMSAILKIKKNMQEMTDLLKALDTKFENRSALALTILVGTSFLCVDLLVSRDTIS